MKSTIHITPGQARTLTPRPEGASELWIFGHWRQANVAGFIGGRHHTYPWMLSWCVESDTYDRVRGVQLSRVIRTSSAVTSLFHATQRQRDEYDRMIELARAMLRVEPRVWIEL